MSDDTRYALATVHVFIALRRIVVALIFLQKKPPGPIPYLANIGDPLNRAKDLIYITNVGLDSYAMQLFLSLVTLYS